MIASLLLTAVIQGVTFASKPGEVFVPLREAAPLVGWKLTYYADLDLASLNGKTLDPFLPRLSDGSVLISLSELKARGAHPTFKIAVGPKRVEVDLSRQVLRAWQGTMLVYLWPVSSGREGKTTPNGDFVAGEKEPMHISKLYGSPMPFSVHVTGNIYIHGSDRFSSEPGSHGCIRLPLMEARNVAEEFYNWIEPGVPIRVRGAYNFLKRNS